MNKLQKEQIIRLRMDGLGYTKIAQMLGISQNTIKSFCRRNNLAGQVGAQSIQTSVKQSFCKKCGKPLEDKDGGKSRKFCSDSCRLNWWKDHPELVNKKAIYHFTCACCGNKFNSYGNKERKYCSHPCYIKDRFEGKKKAGDLP